MLFILSATCLSILTVNLITLLTAHFTTPRKVLCTMYTTTLHRTPKQLKTTPHLSVRARYQHSSSRRAMAGLITGPTPELHVSPLIA